MSTPMSVSVFGEMPSATQVRMMARSGNMQIVPMVPVNVIRDGVDRLFPSLESARDGSELVAGRPRSREYNEGFDSTYENAT